jgi:hypothetical protein
MLSLAKMSGSAVENEQTAAAPHSSADNRTFATCLLGGVLCLLSCRAASMDVITPPPPDPSDSLIAHWTFDEGSGDVALDDSGNRHDGQLTGGTWISDGRFGGGLRLATGNSVAVPNFPAATSNWSVSAWIRMSPDQLEAIRGIGTVLTTENYKSNGWELNVERMSAQPIFVFSYWSPSLGDYLHTECSCLETNAWVHLAAVADAGTNRVTLYVNGSAMDQQNKVSDILVGDTALYFGRWNMEGRFLSGDLDDIAIWGRALAENEIVALRNESPGSRSAP